MNIILFGAAGFIGKNLIIRLVQNKNNKFILVDKSKSYFSDIMNYLTPNTVIKEEEFSEKLEFDRLLEGQDVVYHLVSTTVPTTSNQHIVQELKVNVLATVNLLEACNRCGVKKVIFFSSGGTVYGKNAICPIKEETPSYPISSYGLQKVSIEKLLYLYGYMYNLDYRIIRLSNPYGPYQRPNGIQGAVTTFTYRALKNEKIVVYGDGSVVRDFIYIEDAIKAILNIVNEESEHRIFNIGCGYGTSIKELLETIRCVLGKELDILYMPQRKVDVPENYLDISRYENRYGRLNATSLQDGIHLTVEFLKQEFNI